MNETILVVDDEREIADLVEFYLQNEGYNVCKFYSGAEALKCVAARQLDLAILDIMLPDVNGYEICRSIREKHTYPILMLTAKEEEIDKITGLATMSQSRSGLWNWWRASRRSFGAIRVTTTGRAIAARTYWRCAGLR